MISYDRRSIGIPLAWYAVGTAIVLLGVQFGRAFLKPWPGGDGVIPPEFFSSMSHWDGGWYRGLVQSGYSSPNAFAFFPAYPLIGRAVTWITQLPPNVALLLTSNLSLVAALVLLYAYQRRRLPEDPSTPQWTLASATLLPTTFFFRMAYSESLLLFVIALFLFGIAQRWPAWTLALIAGLGTAVRPTGIALLFPLAIHLYAQPGTRGARLARLGWLVPGAWGLLAYMAFCSARAHDPLAFVHAVATWHVRRHVTFVEKLGAVVSFGAIRSVFNTSSGLHFTRVNPMTPAFNLYLANSIYFVLAVVLVAVGARKRWLNPVEVALGIALIAIPYLSHAYETSMESMGRYMSIVVPAHAAAGHALKRASLVVSTGLVAFSAFLLFAYSALYAVSYWLI